MKSSYQWLVPFFVFGSLSSAANLPTRGFVQDLHADNEALIVNVLHGLPGGDSNIKNMKAIVSDPNYLFNATVLANSQATVAQIQAQLTKLAAQVGPNGTLLFYFGGHGGNQIVWVNERNMKTQEIRAAIEEGRKDLGPLARLVMIFDACDAGSNIGPLRQSLFADEIAKEMEAGRDRAYWDRLIVMTSSRADELSWANDGGHMFTQAVSKAFPVSLSLNETIGEFFKRSSGNLTASHPTYKVVPAELMDEKMIP